MTEEEDNSNLRIAVQQEQVHDLLFNREIGWQEIIYDLINTEQLDPWNVDIIILTEKYMDKISKLEEADFFVSSKVLLAASLLLRIKSEILLNKYIKSIDEILFGRKVESARKGLERIELDEEIPDLIPRSPIPRFKRVTLSELIESLNKAIITENRRIKKEVVKKNALRESSFSLPNSKSISIKDRIKEIFEKLAGHFKSNNVKKVTYTEFVGIEKEKKIEHFSPLLHLENQQKVWMHQSEPFNEIDIWLKKTFVEYNGHPFQDLIDELKDGTYTPIDNTSDEEFNKFSEVEDSEESTEK
jgi:segregation and condensation protein A